MLLTGVERFLFTPLALAVVFAMLTSYLLSRTLVPTMAPPACDFIGTVPLLWVVGEDFFPDVEAGLMKLHVRAPTGTRIERTEQIVDEVGGSIRRIIPPTELVALSDNIDIPISYDLAFYPTDNMGPQDAEILIQLYGSHRTPTSVYQDRIRRTMAADYPNVTGYFQAADIVISDCPRRSMCRSREMTYTLITALPRVFNR